MGETLITFETAKLAKEKMFGLGENDYIQLPTLYELNGSLYNNGKLEASVGHVYTKSPNHLGAPTISDFKASVFTLDNSLDDFILAPTQSLLQKWLRETHMIRVYPTHSSCGTFNYEIYIWDNPNDIGLWTRIGNVPSFGSFEESLEKGLQEALKLII